MENINEGRPSNSDHGSKSLDRKTREALYDAMAALYVAVQSAANDLYDDGSRSGPLRGHALSQSYWRAYNILTEENLIDH